MESPARRQSLYDKSMKVIAYLAPEIPALSATFVYNEIIALQCSGYTVVPLVMSQRVTG